MIRIGELLLNRGIYKSQRVVSEDYIDAATLPQTPKDDYQYGFYFHINELASSSQGRHLNLPDGYHALGQGEQFITVSPRKKLVIAGFGSSWQTSRAENPPRRGNTKTFKAFDLLNKTIIDEV
jgi:CubicO group peptidase (beta-lactamase class C family)